ncbi:glycosyltransferase family 2 protein [candidate division WWE3 bacterium]|nr:glycosyltransferase family 2 protein [candidate division WWE3 bacterium]
MRFSVVLATYNRLELLKECLDSLFSQTMSHDEFEVIVIDNGSTDGSLDYLSSLQQSVLATRNVSFKFISLQANPGPAIARNRGIQIAQGDIVAMTDDDCVPPLNWLEKIDDGFKRYPEVIGVTGFQQAHPKVLASNLIAQYERYQTREMYHAKDREIVGGWDVPAGVTNNVAFKRSVLIEVNGFDEHFPVAAGEDADLKKQITDKGYKILYIPIGVEHHQEYSLKRFLHQQYIRGIGARHFRRKWEGYDTINWLLVVKSVPKFFMTLIQTKNPQFAGLEFLGRIWMFRGELKGAKK